MMSKAEREFWAALEEEKTRTLEEDMQRWNAESSPDYVAPSSEIERLQKVRNPGRAKAEPGGPVSSVAK